MDLGLGGAVAVVTGASRGIGLAVAQTLAAEGAHVVAGAREPGPDLDALAQAGKAHTLAVDLGTAEGPGRLAELALTEFGRIDVLVNNVGAVTPRPNGFLLVTDDEWSRSLTLNLLSAIRATRAVLPAMVTAGRGSIVTIASINASLPDPGVIDYSAAKAALINFTKSVSKEFGPHGIRANAINPGPVATRLWLGSGGVAETIAATTGANPESVAEEAAAHAVTGRFTQPAEVANLAAFLASDRVAGNITGAAFAIDGGYSTETH
ncbi:3-oxoacyl-[acyl-carrier protein] reductase (EC [Amycolatopsis camponoti]|uniref:3-oxoacyl-[acyl-carrier protein] reductase (EC) n=1 Tax=Amycolatopsis camponoti TaxID=2606593 RepID=A0A6I8LQ10_9PSEU|nr:SDR family oxidoreductase [Amycolatopsis camponoti]VVJ18007.1 3-oxoacyl-[acyl-carrier protein] reductase (EC [Amycolatopsis camponoti]